MHSGQTINIEKYIPSKLFVYNEICTGTQCCCHLLVAYRVTNEGLTSSVQLNHVNPHRKRVLALSPSPSHTHSLSLSLSLTHTHTHIHARTREYTRKQTTVTSTLQYIQVHPVHDILCRPGLRQQCTAISSTSWPCCTALEAHSISPSP